MWGQKSKKRMKIKKLISISILLILFVSSFPIIFNFGTEHSNARAKTITVNDDGGADYKRIQRAINNANTGDTIRVWAGVYNENIKINKRLTIIGNGSTNTTINGNGIGDVVNITADYVHFSNFTVKNSGNEWESFDYDAGIQLYSSDHSIIENCSCISNYHGINIHDSDYNIVKNNNCSFNLGGTGVGGVGILIFYWSDYNIITDNYCSSNGNKGGFGIYIHGVFSRSKNNRLINNTCINNTLGINIFFLEGLDTDLIQNNCSYNKGGIQLYGQGGTAVVKNNICNFNKGEGFHLSGYYKGIIINNTFSKNSDGVWMEFNSYCELRNNTVNSNKLHGIQARSVIKNISIENNRIYNNSIGINISKNGIIEIKNSSIINSSIYDLILFYNTQITAINCSFNNNKVFYETSISKLNRKWFLNVKVIDGSNNVIPNATVSIKNITGSEKFNGKTGPDGMIQWLELPEYVGYDKNNNHNDTDVGERFYHTPYNITANKTGYGYGYAVPEVNLNQSKIVVIMIGNDTFGPNMKLISPRNNYYRNSKTNISIIEKIKDYSGVNKSSVTIWYRINNRNWYNSSYGKNGNDTESFILENNWSVNRELYNVNFNVSSLKSGDIVEWYWMANDTKNYSGIDPINAPNKTYKLTIDRIPSIIINPAPNENCWINGLVNFSINLYDNISGINPNSVRIKWDDSTYGSGDGWIKPNFASTNNASMIFNTSSIELRTGSHTLFWYVLDNASNSKILGINYFIDNQAPNTTLSISSPKYRLNPTDIWNITSKTIFEFFAKENGSGLNNTQFRIDNRTWKIYNKSFNLSTIGEGIHNLYFRSMDNLSNIEPTKNLQIFIDDTSPKTTINISNPKVGNNPVKVRSTTQFTLNTDNDTNGSGVSYTWYKLNYGPLKIYEGHFIIPIGTTFIEWGSVDNVGNNETGNSISVLVDDSSPFTSLEIIGANYGSDPKYITTSTQFVLTSNDKQGAGIAFSWFRLNDGPIQIYSGPFTVPIGTTMVGWGSQDLLGNNETGNIMNIYIDNIPPITKLKISNPKHGSNPTYITTSTQFVLKHNNDSDGAGVAFSWYRLNGGTSQTYSSSFTVPLDTTLIEWGSVDQLGNNETENSIEIIVDDTSPFTNLEISSPKFGTNPIYITTSTKFNLIHDSDLEGVGVNFSWYILNEDDFHVYSESFTVPEDTILIEWGSEDLLENNETFNSLSIEVDTLPPTTEIIIDKPSYGNKTIYLTSDTKISFKAIDFQSGIKDIYYRINNQNWIKFKNDFYLSTDGEYILFFYSLDNLGNKESRSEIRIIVDNTPPDKPTLNYFSSLTKYRFVNITGSSEPTCEIKIFRDDNIIGITTSNDNGDFNIRITLNEGENIITARAFDSFNRASELSIPRVVFLDSIKPEIIDYTPGNFEKDISVDITIKITFNEPMNRVTTEGAFSILPSINGDFIWNDNILEFHPENNFSYNTQYTVIFNINGTDLASNNLSNGYSRTFKTTILDSDGDRYSDDIDKFPDDSNEWLDIDDDTIGNNADSDDDGDLYLDDWEVFLNTDPLNKSSKPLDTDSDGAPDGDKGNSMLWMDRDDDNDGYPDKEELKAGTDPLKKDNHPQDANKKNEDNSPMIFVSMALIIMITILILILLFSRFKVRPKKRTIKISEINFDLYKIQK